MKTAVAQLTRTVIIIIMGIIIVREKFINFSNLKCKQDVSYTAYNIVQCSGKSFI